MTNNELVSILQVFTAMHKRVMIYHLQHFENRANSEESLEVKKNLENEIKVIKTLDVQLIKLEEILKGELK